MSQIVRRRIALGAAVLLTPMLVLSPAAAHRGDPDGQDAPGQRERIEQEREQREGARREREQQEEARAAGQTTWSIVPAREGEDEAARTSLRLELEPGEVASDAVTVTNYSSHPATFVVYASDGIVTADGQFDVLPAASEATGAGAWLSVGENEPGEAVTVEIAAESDVTIPVEIAVPAEATPGDHPAGVVAALAQESAGVGLDSRVGTRIHLRVAGELEPALVAREVSASYQSSWNPFAPGTLRLEYRLANTGNVRLGGQSEAHGSSVLGLGRRSGPGTEHREVLPGQEASSVVELENVWPLVRYSGEIRTVPVTVGDDVLEVSLEPATTHWSAWTLPWQHLAALGLVVVALILRRRNRRRRAARTQAQIEAAVARGRAESAVPSEV